MYSEFSHEKMVIFHSEMMGLPWKLRQVTHPILRTSRRQECLVVSEWDRNSVAAAGGTTCFDGLVMNSGYEWDMSYYPMKHAMTMDMVIDMVIHYPN
jgi:hypothetical protein